MPFFESQSFLHLEAPDVSLFFITFLTRAHLFDEAQNVIDNLGQVIDQLTSDINEQFQNEEIRFSMTLFHYRMADEFFGAGKYQEALDHYIECHEGYTTGKLHLYLLDAIWQCDCKLVLEELSTAASEALEALQP